MGALRPVAGRDRERAGEHALIEQPADHRSEPAITHPEDIRAAGALAGDESLSDFSGFVADSGEGRWTLNAAIEESVPANVLSAALYARFRSREDASYADKLLSAMRKGFGGHQEPK